MFKNLLKRIDSILNNVQKIMYTIKDTITIVITFIIDVIECTINKFNSYNKEECTCN